MQTNLFEAPNEPTPGACSVPLDRLVSKPGHGGMGSHHSARAMKDEWLTPPGIVSALGEFDLDPCSPVDRPWPISHQHPLLGFICILLRPLLPTTKYVDLVVLRHSELAFPSDSELAFYPLGNGAFYF